MNIKGNIQQHTTFLDLDITIEDNIFVYNIFDKKDKFSFLIVRMPYLPSKIALSKLYGSLFSESLRKAHGTLRMTYFMPMESKLYTRMVSQGGIKTSIAVT